MPDNFDKFTNAIREKFLFRVKNDNRPLEPWNEYSFKFLWQRFEEEMEEYNCATTNKARVEEIIDISAFAMFIWKKHIDKIDTLMEE